MEPYYILFIGAITSQIKSFVSEFRLPIFQAFLCLKKYILLKRFYRPEAQEAYKTTISVFPRLNFIDNEESQPETATTRAQKSGHT